MGHSPGEAEYNGFRMAPSSASMANCGGAACVLGVELCMGVEDGFVSCQPSTPESGM